MEVGLSVAAIVLGFDRLAKTRACVASLLRSEHVDLRVLLFDNGSSDGTAEAIAAEFPDVQVVGSPTNLGAAEGRNRAVGAATTAWAPELLWFVDDDAEVHPGAGAALATPFQEPDADRLGATAGKIRYPGEPARIYVAGGSELHLWRGDTSPRGQGELDRGQYDRREPCVPGAGCTMVRREAFEAVGGFDPAYDPYGYEDLDFSLRLIESGWRVLYVPEAVAWHERGNTLGRGRYTAQYAKIKRRNWLRFLRRHGSWFDRAAFWSVGAPLLLGRALIRELGRGNLSAVGGLLGFGREGR
ncbi:MAG: glycosyltransferase family 2 protein [Gemmatimonadales bacterium]|jgi:GT2 family glycosyltransferase